MASSSQLGINTLLLVSNDSVTRLRRSFRATVGQLFSKPNIDKEEVEKDCFTQDVVPDIFFVLVRDNGTTAKVDAER
jgi:hypothetical protein